MENRFLAVIKTDVHTPAYCVVPEELQQINIQQKYLLKSLSTGTHRVTRVNGNVSAAF